VNSEGLPFWLIAVAVCAYCAAQTYLDIGRRKWGMMVAGALATLALGVTVFGIGHFVFDPGIR
jgi:hypothetical protein